MVFNWRRNDIERKKLRMYLFTVYIRSTIDMLSMVYVLIYFKTNISPDKIALINMSTSIMGLSMIFMLQSDRYLQFIRTNFIWCILNGFLCSIMQAIICLNYPAIANFIMLVLSRVLWRSTSVVNEDAINRKYHGRKRTRVFIWTRIHAQMGGIAGSIIAWILDATCGVSIYGIAILLFATDGLYAIGEYVIYKTMKK